MKNPTGALKTELPEGTLAFRFAPSSLGDDAKQIIREQKNKGYTLPSNMVVVGLPLGTTHKDGTEWKNLKLADGRIVSISVSGLTKTKTISDIGVRFLLNEKRIGRRYTDQDKIEIDGVPVTFINYWETASPPWVTRSYEWIWASLFIGFGIATYLLVWAIGWIVKGFSRANSGATS